MPSGGSIATIATGPECAEGCTIQLADGGTYGPFNIYGRNHIHIVANNGATITGHSYIAPCSGSIDYAKYDYDAFYNVPTPEPYYNGGTARECFTHPAEDFYFKNITWDGQNATNTALESVTVRDVVCDNCTFKNFVFQNVTWEVGLFTFDRGSNNIWCRHCHFVGRQRMAIFWDGVHSGGIIDSTFESAYLEYIEMSTNDDFSIDLNNDGVYQLPEQRNAQYIVIEGNTFNESQKSLVNEGIVIKGMQTLVDHNTVNGSIPGNDFVRYNAQCSAHLLDTKSHYHNDHHWLIDNTVNGSVNVFALFDTSSGDPATPGVGCENHTIGYTGIYTIQGNVVTHPPAGYQLIKVVPSHVPLEAPNEASANKP